MFTDSYTLFTEPTAADKPKVDIETIVNAKLPSMPGSAMRVLTLLRDINTPGRKLAEAVGCDPSLTTRVLRLANSPIYALQKNVSSLLQAVDVVGAKYLYDITIINLTADTFASEISGLALGRSIWEHSLAVALLAREFSRILGLRGTEEVFICGLLHDIGKIMLLRADVKTYSEILEKKGETEMLNWEVEIFGYTHAQVGALVIRRWQLPEIICHAILNHHNTSQAVEAVLISHLINIADSVANFHGYGLRHEEETILSNLESAIVLRLDESQIEAAWENIQTDLNEIAKMFN